MRIENRRVVITGGSSGIGLALAKALGAAGARVAITGRRAALLDQAVKDLAKDGIVAHAIVADVSTETGRATTLNDAVAALGGVDILVNNAGSVRAGRLEDTTEAEIRVTLDVDLLAPILLTQTALPLLRQSGEAMVINVASGIALIGMPFYATYAADKAGLARFGEALRCELHDEGVHVMTVYPGATDTPMMQSSKAGPDLGFVREPASAVADAIVDGIRKDSFEVIRGGEARAKMIALNRDDPAALNSRFGGIKSQLAEAVRDHTAL